MTKFLAPNVPLLRSLIVTAALGATAACTDDDPSPTNDTGTGSDVADASDAMDATDGPALDVDIPDPTCEPLASDYSPGADDEWEECISDDGTYHQIEASVSSIGRVAAFEEIADLLWRNPAPTPDDFISARDLYATGEGLDSRLQRREDEHYPPVTDGETGDTLQCRDEGVPALDPDRCVGPAQMLPIINDAFQKGIQGEDAHIQAARLEATLLWFLYVSSYKEASTCANVAKDCDSAWAYYAGGEPESGGIGLAGYIRELVPDTHARAWDGVLAVRCWRDLDDAEVAEDLELQARALAQLDTALLHGVATIVIDRIATWYGASGADREAAAAFIEILGPVLDREAAERDAAKAAILAAAWGDLEGADIDELVLTISEIFPCP